MESNRPDLNRLLTFLAIAEAGGVTPAARRLALTRSAVSHSLTSLEASLGIALFQRVGRGLVPTREGTLLRRALADVRDQLDAALDEVVGAGSEVRGPVRLGLFLGFSRFRLAGVIDSFLREHARARVRVAFGPHAWLLDELLAGRLDFSLALRPPREPGAQVRSEKLFEQTLVLATRPVRRSRSATGLDAVAALEIVDYYQADPLIDRWTRHHFAGRRVPRERIRAWAASTDLALELVLRGAGAAVLPLDLVEPFRRRRELAVVDGPREPLRDTVWLNQLARVRPNRAQTVFRALLLGSLRAA
jgi:DNA-binding transcriptional LysR family regulator